VQSNAAAPKIWAPNPESPIRNGIFLNESKSLELLFGLSSLKDAAGQEAPAPDQLSLVSFELGPEYYVMFRRPFRVSALETPSGAGDQPCFLVGREVTENGALMVADDGKTRWVDREFLFRHWGGTVSWVVPQRPGVQFSRGEQGPAVRTLEERLDRLGYRLNADGVYDAATQQAVRKFQEDFGLMSDGIAGPRTRALIYQISPPGASVQSEDGAS
jgi:hypothetical protein